ncbi:ribose-5-phosphate isomerase RpiA [Pontibacter diazotrophicus]|uniref:Ribose-5-phosphate isomerase A n=1 Tax=Pontibacter diazotrophicus TaxID=1400979 RepID=A0A3D8LAY6_9BACT|nr:ribose-5-phosphate isomerase RpiA [Pontibacter diazotrophicus]RDV14565.1 ribose-5-phosphate isomerase RpiA [Pontibacter diazotrophicus]
MDAKKLAAESAVEYVEDGMTVGLGTGSTASWAIKALGEKVKAGLHIQAVASSVASEDLAKQYGIQLTDFSELSRIDVTIDGADEVDAQCNLIKGGGGALLREKIIAYNSSQFIVVVDESKLVRTLGKFPLPVEIVPFAAELTLKQLKNLGCETSIRQKDGKNFVTDNGNLIADCFFNQIEVPELLNNSILLIPGVVESGLFLHPKVHRVIVGYADGTLHLLKGDKKK